MLHLPSQALVAELRRLLPNNQAPAGNEQAQEPASSVEPARTQTEDAADDDALRHEEEADVVHRGDEESFALEKNASSYNTVVVECGGDGDCMPCSIAQQVYGNPSRHTEIRALIVQRLQNNRDLYENYAVPSDNDVGTWVAYLKKVAQPGTYLGHVELQVVQ